MEWLYDSPIFFIIFIIGGMVWAFLYGFIESHEYNLQKMLFTIIVLFLQSLILIYLGHFSFLIFTIILIVGIIIYFETKQKKKEYDVLKEKSEIRKKEMNNEFFIKWIKDISGDRIINVNGIIIEDDEFDKLLDEWLIESHPKLFP